jgi:glycosyltransferase involved in cell wall biosynthesis
VTAEEPQRPPPSVTVAVPLYNEEPGIERLIKTVSDVLTSLPRSGDHEIICVDDGSSDGTLGELLRLRAEYPRLRVVSLSRNFGHQAALSAALDAVRTEVAFIIDGDLQDDPALLPRFLDEYRRGADVVYAIRRQRSDSLWLRAAYSLHYRLLSLISDTSIPVDAGDFSLLSRRAIEELNALPERQRYLRGLRAWVGLEQVGIPVERGERFAGTSKYSIGDLVRLSLSGLLAFSIVPLRVATVLGGLTVVAGVGYGIFVLIDRLTGGPPQGFATLALLQIIFAGMILLVLGVIGEYIGRIYEEVKRRPVYVVAAEWDLEASDG